MERAPDAAALERVVERWGIRRSHPRFWQYFHDLSRYIQETDPMEAGVLDMNRYQNLCEAPGDAPSHRRVLS